VSADLRKEYGVLSDEAVTLVKHIKDHNRLAHPHEWIKGVEARAIAAYICEFSATALRVSGAATTEMMIIACVRFNVQPAWFYTDEDGTLDKTAETELRARVAYYRIMHGLDGDDE